MNKIYVLLIGLVMFLLGMSVSFFLFYKSSNEVVKVPTLATSTSSAAHNSVQLATITSPVATQTTDLPESKSTATDVAVKSVTKMGIAYDSSLGFTIATDSMANVGGDISAYTTFTRGSTEVRVGTISPSGSACPPIHMDIRMENNKVVVNKISQRYFPEKEYLKSECGGMSYGTGFGQFNYNNKGYDVYFSSLDTTVANKQITVNDLQLVINFIQSLEFVN